MGGGEQNLLNFSKSEKIAIDDFRVIEAKNSSYEDLMLR